MNEELVATVEYGIGGWWAYVRVKGVDPGPYDIYVERFPCVTYWGARWKAKRMLRSQQKFRGYKEQVTLDDGLDTDPLV